MEVLEKIRQAEAASHREAYSTHALFAPGSWLAKPVKTVLELLPLFEGCEAFRGLDLGSGVGRNSIPVAQAFSHIPCRVECVDILDLAIEKLLENARYYGVADAIRGTVSSIEAYPIAPDSYDLILAVSSLEHTDSVVGLERKLMEIRDGLRPGGIACLIVNTGVREQDKVTGAVLRPQFEVNLPTEDMHRLLKKIYGDFDILKDTVVHQCYDIPREGGLAALETDVVTYAVRRR